MKSWRSGFHLPSPRALPLPTRVAAGLTGSFLAALFIYGLGGEPLVSVLFLGLGCLAIWLIQAARTGSSQSWRSILWFTAWYAIYVAAWQIAEAITPRPSGQHSLSGTVALSVLFGSIVVILFAHAVSRRRLREGRSPTSGCS